MTCKAVKLHLILKPQREYKWEALHREAIENQNDENRINKAITLNMLFITQMCSCFSGLQGNDPVQYEAILFKTCTSTTSLLYILAAQKSVKNFSFYYQVRGSKSARRMVARSSPRPQSLSNVNAMAPRLHWWTTYSTETTDKCPFPIRSILGGLLTRGTTSLALCYVLMKQLSPRPPSHLQYTDLCTLCSFEVHTSAYKSVFCP